MVLPGSAESAGRSLLSAWKRVGAYVHANTHQLLMSEDLPQEFLGSGGSALNIAKKAFR